ncbi:hypothetical protein FKM82_010289 [Ascaphus truei]
MKMYTYMCSCKIDFPVSGVSGCPTSYLSSWSGFLSQPEDILLIIDCSIQTVQKKKIVLDSCCSFMNNRFSAPESFTIIL